MFFECGQVGADDRRVKPKAVAAGQYSLLTERLSGHVERGTQERPRPLVARPRPEGRRHLIAAHRAGATHGKDGEQGQPSPLRNAAGQRPRLSATRATPAGNLTGDTPW